ncbi:MAG: hypothetical protein KGN36_15995 [Acidobacteriota bacterium]|nr:hypothetical protein [Acidobacteriota bacterium]
MASGEGTSGRTRAGRVTAKKVVPLYPGAQGPGDPDVAGPDAPAAPRDAVPASDVLSAPDILAAEDARAAAEFEALLRLGRTKGGLTQDDVVSVLESVELSADLIVGVVERIREAGIEFTYDAGDTSIVPLATAPPAGPAPRPEPKVRLVPVALVLMGSAGAGQSQTFSGNWHLDVGKSSWGEVSRPVSVVVVIDHREPAISYQGTVIYANEDTRAFGFAGAFDGRQYPMSRSYGNGTITLQRVDSYTFSSTFRSADGQYIEAARTTVSRDGRTLRRRLNLRSPEGTKAWTEVYRKM